MFARLPWKVNRIGSSAKRIDEGDVQDLDEQDDSENAERNCHEPAERRGRDERLAGPQSIGSDIVIWHFEPHHSSGRFGRP